MSMNIRPARGMTMVLLAWVIITLLAWAALGGDLTKGYTFTPTDRVTSTKLNGIVDDAVINATFITGKSVGTPDASDSMVFYSAGSSGLRKATLNSLFLQNSVLITGQTEDTSPVTGDYVLTYDASAAALRKATLLNLVFTNAALINGRTNWPTPARDTTYLLAYDTGTGEWSKLSRSNLFWQMFEFNTWTNQPTNATPGALDAIPIYDYAAGTNKSTTITAIFTNRPVIMTNDAGGFIYTETNSVPSKMTLNNLSNYVAGGLVANVLPRKFVSSLVAGSGISGAGKPIDAAHSLAATPQQVRAVLVCTTANLNYSVGDEVDVLNVWSGGLQTNPINVFANATNAGVVVRSAASDWQIANKTSGSSTLATITAGSWSVKVYATYFP